VPCQREPDRDMAADSAGAVDTDAHGEVPC
jgi:hypothetical protein